MGTLDAIMTVLADIYGTIFSLSPETSTSLLGATKIFIQGLMSLWEVLQNLFALMQGG